MLTDRERIIKLRERTGAGLMETADVFFNKAGKDPWLAEGILRNQGLAIAIMPREGETSEEAYHRWMMARATHHADSIRKTVEY